jgi:hypothetical protein
MFAKILFVAFIRLLQISFAFPDSGNPISGQPPLDRPKTKFFEFSVIDFADCSYYGEVITQKFTPPTFSDGPWSKIILDVNATVKGVQFDRFGALWIGEVEVLRTTTPEPTADGIKWVIEKDVTAYGSYFQNSNLSAYLSIPNNVDSTYTGIIQVSVKMTYYKADETNLEADFPLVIPLTKATNTSNDLFSSMSLTGDQFLQYKFNLDSLSPLNYDNNNNNENEDNNLKINRVFVDIYASPHGCEEFYYTNLPDDIADEYDFCGGGVYREVFFFLFYFFINFFFLFILYYYYYYNYFFLIIIHFNNFNIHCRNNIF